jgi:steroid delta-isomerase-like uncharacterized protein
LSAKDLRAVKRRLFDEYNKGKAAAMTAMDKFYATDVVFHSGTGEDLRGLRDYNHHNSDLYDAFPGIHWTIDQMIVEGNKEATCFTLTGTHKGTFRGIRPTNKRVTIRAISIGHHNADGKILEEWHKYDTLGLMQQLGVMPTPRRETSPH